MNMNFLQSKTNNTIKNKPTGFTPTPINIGVSSQGEWGFTLVETLVAISILLMAVVVPLVLISGNIALIFSVKDKITATYLAEDAIDFIKYKIDTNFNTPQYWLTGIPCVGGGACQVDSFNDAMVLCSGTCPVLQFDSTTGIYGYSSGSASKFTRTVTITGLTPSTNDPYPTMAPQEVIITATVSWQDHGASKQTTISEHAFSWGT
ncbi:MAG: hypothetical protein HY818_00455 [Acetobacterium woodii]|nr:hypothetical protein [Acetobacterium woodii]